MLAYAVLLTALIVGGFGWMNSRFVAMNTKIGGLDAKIDETREEMIQRLTAIETIIKERIPSASRWVPTAAPATSQAVRCAGRRQDVFAVQEVNGRHVFQVKAPVPSSHNGAGSSA